jgi:hypothetical protein
LAPAWSTFEALPEIGGAIDVHQRGAQPAIARETRLRRGQEGRGEIRKHERTLGRELGQNLRGQGPRAAADFQHAARSDPPDGDGQCLLRRQEGRVGVDGGRILHIAAWEKHVQRLGLAGEDRG